MKKQILCLLVVTTSLFAENLSELEQEWNALPLPEPHHLLGIRDRDLENFAIYTRGTEIASKAALALLKDPKASESDKQRWLDRLTHTVNNQRSYFYERQTGSHAFHLRHFNPVEQPEQWASYAAVAKTLSGSDPLVKALIRRSTPESLTFLEALSENPAARKTVNDTALRPGKNREHAIDLEMQRTWVGAPAYPAETVRVLSAVLQEKLKKEKFPNKWNGVDFRTQDVWDALTKTKEQDLVADYWRMATKDPQPEIRGEALEQLYGIQGGDAVGVYRKALATDASAIVKKKAAILLGKSGDMESEKALIQSATKGDAMVRVGALEGLKHLGSRAAVPTLKKIIEQRNPEDIRMAAMMAMSGAYKKDPEIRRYMEKMFRVVEDGRDLDYTRYEIATMYDALKEMEKEDGPWEGRSLGAIKTSMHSSFYPTAGNSIRELGRRGELDILMQVIETGKPERREGQSLEVIEKYLKENPERKAEILRRLAAMYGPLTEVHGSAVSAFPFEIIHYLAREGVTKSVELAAKAALDAKSDQAQYEFRLQLCHVLKAFPQGRLTPEQLDLAIKALGNDSSDRQHQDFIDEWRATLQTHLQNLPPFQPNTH